MLPSPCWTVATGYRREKPAPPGTTADLAQSFNFGVTDDALEALVLALHKISLFSLQNKDVQVIDCLDHDPKVHLISARGQGQKQRTFRQRMSVRTSVVRRRLSATDPLIRDRLFAASAEGNARGPSSRKPQNEAEPPKENVGPKRFSWVKFEPHVLPQL